MNEIVLLLISIIPHELGHYLGFRMFGLKPDIKLKWWGIEVGLNQVNKLYLGQYVIINYLGPLAGILFLTSMGVSSLLILVHLFMSILDINNIVLAFHISMNKQFKHKTIGEIEIMQARKILSLTDNKNE